MLFYDLFFFKVGLKASVLGVATFEVHGCKDRILFHRLLVQDFLVQDNVRVKRHD